MRFIPLYISQIKWILKNKTKKRTKRKQNTKPKQTNKNQQKPRGYDWCDWD